MGKLSGKLVRTAGEKSSPCTSIIPNHGGENGESGRTDFDFQRIKREKVVMK